jgi:transposase
MEASKCPKCGDEPHFVDQVEKWYCYGCNSYVEEEEHHVCEDHEKVPSVEAKATEIASELKALDEDDQPTCKVCGAALAKIQGDKLFCFVCESSPEAPAAPAPAADVKPVLVHNEAQAILDSITVPTPVEPTPTPAPTPEPEVKKEPAVEIKMCPACGQPLKYIEKYQRHYCYGCRKYASKETPEKKPEPEKPVLPTVKKCPDCGHELKFIEKYSEHYCHTCKKYPLRVQKRSGELKCPKCAETLRYIEKYQRHYCMACKEYAPKGHGQGPAEKKVCPFCNEQMRWISEYNEWYCYKCKKYSLRPSKPVLLI